MTSTTPLCEGIMKSNYNSTTVSLPNADRREWSDGATALGKLSVPSRPTNLDSSKARAYCACRRCGWGLCFGDFFSVVYLFSFSSFL